MDRKNLKDNINPSYYKRSIQVTDFIIEYDMNFLEGNIIKYVTRYKEKNGLEDLIKAKWYLDKLIEEQHDRRNKKKNS